MAYIQIISGTGGYLAEGVAASRPAAPLTPTGGIAIYYATDTGVTSLYDISTTAWVTIAGGSSTAGGSNHQVQYNNAGVLGGIAQTNGQLLIGSTGATPVAATLATSTGISVTTGAGSLTVNNTGVTSAVAGSGIAVSGATGAVTISLASAASGTNWVAKTANYSVTSGDTGIDFVNTGAAGTVIFTLPTGVTNVVFGFLVDAAHTVEVLAGGTDTITLIDTATSAGGNLQSATPGNYIRISCYKSGAWIATSALGNWVTA